MSILSERYSSPAMREIWSLENKYRQERDLWILLMKAQARSGFNFPDDAISNYERVKDEINLSSIDARERVLRHDVKARIEEFNSLAGHELIHLGLTSRDVTDNVELFQIRQSLLLVRSKAQSLLVRLANLAERYADLPMVGRTHNVPAQVTTLGKRWATWGEELLYALKNVEDLLSRLPLRGIKGAIGTSFDQQELLGKSNLRLDDDLLRVWGFESSLISPSQIYPRSIDFEVVAALHQLASAPSTTATNIRLMSGFSLVSEGFAKGQVGSSAMPHKVNPRLSERINSLFVILKGYVTMAASISGEQWNEGDVSCSAVRRVVLPDSFYVIDGIIDTTISVIDNLEVFEDGIRSELNQFLPLMLTTQILMQAVKSGVGREEAHEIIKLHVRESQTESKIGKKQMFIERIANDPRLKIKASDLQEVLNSPLKLAGDAPLQTRKVVNLIRDLANSREITDYKPDIRN